MKKYDRNIPYNQLPPLASRRLAELKGPASTLPNQFIFVNTIALREAKASSAIDIIKLLV